MSKIGYACRAKGYYLSVTRLSCLTKTHIITMEKYVPFMAKLQGNITQQLPAWNVPFAMHFEKALDNGAERRYQLLSGRDQYNEFPSSAHIVFRMQQEMEKEPEEPSCLKDCAMKEKIYHEIMDVLCSGLASELVKRLETQ